MIEAFIFLFLAQTADSCRLGAQALDRRELPAAERFLKQCVNLSGSQLESYLQLCAVYQLQGKPEELFQAAFEGLKRFPEEKRFYITAGVHAGREKRFAQAVQILEEASRRWPEDAQVRQFLESAHAGRGMELLDAGDSETAEKHLRQATQLTDSDVEAHLNLGRALHNLHRTAEALSQFNRVLALSPALPLARFHRGLTLYTIGEFDRAIADLTAEIGTNSDYPPGYLVRGLAWMAKGEASQALPDLEMATQRMPDNAKAKYAHARCLLQLGKAADAEAVLRKSIELGPSDPGPLNTLGRLLLQSGRGNEAAPLLRRAEQLSRTQRTAAPGEIRFEDLRARRTR